MPSSWGPTGGHSPALDQGSQNTFILLFILSLLRIENLRFLFLQALSLMTAEDEEQLMECWREIAHHRDISQNVSIMQEYLDLWHLTPFYDPQAIILGVGVKR